MHEKINFISSLEKQITLTSLIVMAAQLTAVLGFACTAQEAHKVRDDALVTRKWIAATGWTLSCQRRTLSSTSLLASYIGDLTSFSESHQQPRRNKSSFKMFGTWYQTMDHRLAKPHYDPYFVIEEDFSSPSDLWPSMLMENQQNSTRYKQIDQQNQDNRIFKSLRRAVHWAIRRW